MTLVTAHAFLAPCEVKARALFRNQLPTHVLSLRPLCPSPKHVSPPSCSLSLRMKPKVATAALLAGLQLGGVVEAVAAPVAACSQTANKAELAYSGKQFEMAERLLEEAVGQCEPSTAAVASKRLGDVRVDQGNYAAALQAYQDALRAAATDASLDGMAAGSWFGQGRAHEGMQEWRAAMEDYSSSLAIQSDPAPLLNRAQVRARLAEWPEAAADYEAAADLYLEQRDKRLSYIAKAQSAFALFEDGQAEKAKDILVLLGRKVYSSDVRVALVAVYWSLGEVEKAEGLWEEACQIQGALCNKYTDKAWLLSYRKWTPQLADSIADFLAIRVR